MDRKGIAFPHIERRSRGDKDTFRRYAALGDRFQCEPEPSLTVGLLPRLLRRSRRGRAAIQHESLTAVIAILVTILEPFAIVAAVELAITQS